jgi:hypothetical protein
MKNNNIGEACSTYKETRNVYQILVEIPDGKKHLEDTGVDGTYALDPSGSGKGQWRAIVNKVMNPRVP